MEPYRKPVLAYAKPTKCSWCGGSTERIRNVFKGIDSERYYDSETCLVRGEDREVRRKAALAGRVSSHYLIGAIVLIALALGFIFGGGHRALAHSPETHQADDLADAYADAYGKCCVGDEYSRLRIEEWEPTENGWRIHWHGQWLDVPRNAKVRNVANPDGEAKAWVFGTGDTTYVRCFMAGQLS